MDEADIRAGVLLFKASSWSRTCSLNPEKTRVPEWGRKYQPRQIATTTEWSVHHLLLLYPCSCCIAVFAKSTKAGPGKVNRFLRLKKSNNAIEVIVPNHNYEKIGLCCFCCIASDRCSPFPTWDSAEAKNENIPRTPTLGVDPPSTSGVSTGNTESRTQGTPNVKLDLKARRGNDTALMPEAPKQEHPIPSGFPSVSIPVPILR